MRVFIGMETSGMLRRRFAALGHDTISCDMLPSEDGPSRHHYIGDVFQTLHYLRKRRQWWPDLAIFHPTCTYHTLAGAWAFGDGPYHQKVQPGTLVGAARRNARVQAEADVENLKALPIWRKVIENPRGTLPTRTSLGRPHDVVQPYEFGDDASKATCLWFFDAEGNPVPDMALPRDPRKRVPGRLVERGGRFVERWANQTDSGQNRLPPGVDRWKERSRTYPGIADAMVAWWGQSDPVRVAA